jgi:phosphosulfolactate synthase
MHGSNGGSEDFLGVPARSTKPRTEGLTHVIDKGIPLNQVEGLFETAGDYVDIVKFGWGTSYVTRNLDEKIALYRSFGVPLVCGGTLFEAVVGRDRLDEYRSWLASKGFTHVEVSDGTIDLPHGRKLEFISELAKDFVVMSEVGSKNADVVYAPYQWVDWMKDELDAGAWKVITEAREGGTAGIFRPTGEMRTGLIDEIVHEIDFGDIIFEAPKEASQGWFIRRFGPDVNLGNIPPEEVIPLETLRLGLRSDTLKEILLSERAAIADRI